MLRNKINLQNLFYIDTIQMYDIKQSGLCSEEEFRRKYREFIRESGRPHGRKYDFANLINPIFRAATGSEATTRHSGQNVTK